MTAGPPTGTGPVWRAGRAVVRGVPVQPTTPVYVVQAPPPRSRRGSIAIVLVGALFVMCCVGGVTLAFLLHTSRPTSALGPALPGLNTPVLDGKFEFVVASMSCGHASVSRAFIRRRAQGQFCLVGLSVRNVGTTAQAFADSFQKATGPNGATYGVDTAAGVLANLDGSNVWTTINPGNMVTGTIVFDIPATAAITTVELHDSALSRGVRVQVV